MTPENRLSEILGFNPDTGRSIEPDLMLPAAEKQTKFAEYIKTEMMQTNATEYRIVADKLLLVTRYDDIHTVIRKYYFWAPEALKNIRHYNPQENPGVAFEQEWATIGLNTDGSLIGISIKADGNNLVRLAVPSKELFIKFIDGDRRVSLTYSDLELKSISEVEPIDKESAIDYWSIPKDVSLSDKVRAKSRLDLSELELALLPLMKDPFGAPPEADDFWKIFNYREFVGLEWEKHPRLTRTPTPTPTQNPSKIGYKNSVGNLVRTLNPFRKK